MKTTTDALARKRRMLAEIISAKRLARLKMLKDNPDLDMDAAEILDLPTEVDRIMRDCGGLDESSLDSLIAYHTPGARTRHVW
jgi:hypothetical protein